MDETGILRRSNPVPRSNVWDDEKGFYVQLALPGWQAIHMEVTDLMLTVKGREFGGTAQFSRVFLPTFCRLHPRTSGLSKWAVNSVVSEA